jgi:hypothetical protein
MNLHLVFEELASKLLDLNSNPKKQQKDAAEKQKEEKENGSPLPLFFDALNSDAPLLPLCSCFRSRIWVCSSCWKVSQLAAAVIDFIRFLSFAFRSIQFRNPLMADSIVVELDDDAFEWVLKISVVDAFEWVESAFGSNKSVWIVWRFE